MHVAVLVAKGYHNSTDMLGPDYQTTATGKRQDSLPGLSAKGNVPAQPWDQHSWAPPRHWLMVGKDVRTQNTWEYSHSGTLPRRRLQSAEEKSQQRYSCWARAPVHSCLKTLWQILQPTQQTRTSGTASQTGLWRRREQQPGSRTRTEGKQPWISRINCPNAFSRQECSAAHSHYITSLCRSFGSQNWFRRDYSIAFYIFMFWNSASSNFCSSRGQEAMDKAISCCCKWNSIFPLWISCQSSNYFKYDCPSFRQCFTSPCLPSSHIWLPPSCSQLPLEPLWAPMWVGAHEDRQGAPSAAGSQQARWTTKRSQKVLHLQNPCSWPRSPTPSTICLILFGRKIWAQPWLSPPLTSPTLPALPLAPAPLEHSRTLTPATHLLLLPGLSLHLTCCFQQVSLTFRHQRAQPQSKALDPLCFPFRSPIHPPECAPVPHLCLQGLVLSPKPLFIWSKQPVPTSSMTHPHRNLDRPPLPTRGPEGFPTMTIKCLLPRPAGRNSLLSTSPVWLCAAVSATIQQDPESKRHFHTILVWTSIALPLG